MRSSPAPALPTTSSPTSSETDAPTTSSSQLQCVWRSHSAPDKEGNESMVDSGSILVTGAAGQLGAVGRTVTSLLLERGLPVRAMVHREDDRATALRAAGAEVVMGSPARTSRRLSCR